MVKKTGGTVFWEILDEALKQPHVRKIIEAVESSTDGGVKPEFMALLESKRGDEKALAVLTEAIGGYLVTAVPLLPRPLGANLFASFIESVAVTLYLHGIIGEGTRPVTTGFLLRDSKDPITWGRE